MLEAGRGSVAAVIFPVLACISGPSAEIAAQDSLTVGVGVTYPLLRYHLLC